MKIRVYNKLGEKSELIYIPVISEFNVGDIITIDGNSMKFMGYNMFGTPVFSTLKKKQKETYTGEEILKLMINNKFKENDKIIATEENAYGQIFTSTFTYIDVNNSIFEFVDDEYEDSPLDAFDLVNCSFEIVDMKEHNHTKKLELEKQLVSIKEEECRILYELKKVL